MTEGTSTFTVASSTNLVSVFGTDLFNAIGSILLYVVPIAIAFLLVWYGLRKSRKAISGKI